MLDYYSKYIKYKKKYNDLTNQINQSGGVPGITEQNFKHQCFVDGYKQHSGECWNDSIQTIVTFSYPFEVTQRKALIDVRGEELKAADIVSAAFRNRSHLAPLNIIDTDREKFNKTFIPYLNNLLKRFKDVYKNHFPDLRIKKINTKSTSITCAINALEFTEINFIKSKSEKTRTNHGGNIYNSILTLQSLSFALLDGNSFVNYHIYLVEKLKSVYIGKSINEIILNAQNYFSLDLATNGHAFNVYTCPGGKNYFYDDNNSQSYEFDWINFFNKTITYRTSKESEPINLSEDVDKDLWKYSLINSYYNKILEGNESRLCYYNAVSNKIIVLIGNSDYRMFNFILSENYDEAIPLTENDFICSDCNEILTITGLFIDSANTREEYIRKLELNDFFYCTGYNLNFIRQSVLENFSFTDIKKAILYLSYGLFLNHSEMIANIYTTEGKNILIQIADNSLPHYFYFDDKFTNINQYNYFIEQFNPNNNFKISVFASNKNIGIEVFNINYLNNVTKSQEFIKEIKENFQDNIYNIFENDNFDVLIYLIENNINNCLSYKFNIGDESNKNNCTILFYLIYRLYDDKTESLVTKIIKHMYNNWKNEYRALFENIENIYGNTILAYVLYITDFTNFKTVLNLLYNLEIQKKINIFNKVNTRNETFIFQFVSKLNNDSLDELMRVISLPDLKINFLKLNKSGKNAYQEQLENFKNLDKPSEKIVTKNFANKLNEIIKKIKK